MRTTALYVASAILLFTIVADGVTTQMSSNLQAAIDAASPGDTLQVAPGVYDKVTIKKSLNLVGNDALIRANERDACISIDANDVNISGFLIKEGFYGIRLNGVKGCRISNNTVVRCVQPGIALLFSDDNVIEGNNASFNGLGGEGWYGIYLSNSNNNLIINNTANNNGAYGINLFPSCNNNSIRANVLQGNMYGLYMFTNCALNLIESNIMSKNTNSGLDLRFNCHNNFILNNTIEKNVVAGMTLMDSSRNAIRGNLISSNGHYGMQIQSSSDNNTITNNIISDSQTGIFMESSGNQIHGNRIMENIVQAEERGINAWNAPYLQGGNLWSDYLGRDEMKGPNQDVPGKDGFGDEPYKINEKSFDRYPIMGNQVKQISIIDKSVSSEQAEIGDSIALKARLKSKYGLSQVSVRAFRSGVEAKGYARMLPAGDLYEGTFSTALLDPGRYDIVLSARDTRGYELKETLGEVEILSRRGVSSPLAKSN